jgi:hypothetical protein
MWISPGAVIGFGVGYLLGARAGRERYDAIMRQVRSVQERPEVQSVAGVVSAQAGQIAQKARETLGGRRPGSGGERSPDHDDPADRPSANGLGAVPKT